MRYQEFSPEKLQELPKIEWGHLRLLWHSDYWDGPKSGLLVYQESKYWFGVFEEFEEGPIFRRFLIIALSPDQLAEEENWHELFRQKVGTHTDYDDNGKLLPNTLRPKEIWHEFYDVFRKRLPQDFSNNQLIGWFEF
jgi:hypothetical protein